MRYRRVFAFDSASYERDRYSREEYRRDDPFAPSAREGKRKKERAARLAVSPVLATRGKRENHSEGIKNPRMSTISDISANFFSGDLRERYHSVTFPKKVHVRIIPRISLNAMVLLPAIISHVAEGRRGCSSQRSQ